MVDHAGYEVIERCRDGNYLKILLKDNVIIGAEALGQHVKQLGLLMHAARCCNNIAELQQNAVRIFDLNSALPWFYRRLVNLTEKVTT